MLEHISSNNLWLILFFLTIKQFKLIHAHRAKSRMFKNLARASISINLIFNFFKLCID